MAPPPGSLRAHEAAKVLREATVPPKVAEAVLTLLRARIAALEPVR